MASRTSLIPARSKWITGNKPPVLDHRILSTFPSASTESLPELCDALLHQQRSSWPQLIDGYAALMNVSVREIECEGYSVYVQHNPARIVSSGANVDPGFISVRTCFLCVENLPPEQRGVLYRDEFLFLCNPAPIFHKHLTISHIKHIPQAIEGAISVLLELARDVSPSFTIFYNGPKCGASAPDHLHFQACPSGTIPIEREATNPARREWKKATGSVSVFTLKTIGRQAIVIEGVGSTDVEHCLSRLISAMRDTVRTSEESMMNILCSHKEGTWRVIVFPRRKHRPDVFFKKGTEQVLISPAAVDIGGLVITPVERDFNRVDGRMIQSLYDEVLLDAETVNRIIDAM